MNFLRKTFLTLLFVLFAYTANAQFHFGGSFSINFGNEHTAFSSGATNDKEFAYIISLMPKMYWNLGDKMQVGGRIGFAFGRIASGTVYGTDKTGLEGAKDDYNSVNRAIGWSLSPFFGYRLLNWKKVSVWAEANAFVGQYYNTDRKSSSTEWGRQTEYGFQILPVVNIDLTEKLALQLHIGFISLGWYGTRSDYMDRVVTTSTWDLHKGGFSGIAQGLADYGIGLVKKF